MYLLWRILLSSHRCPTSIADRFLTGNWKPLIVFFLIDGPKRYGELKRSVRDASDKVPIQQLKELESDGVVIRTDYREISPRVDYSLSLLGQSLAKTLVPLCESGTENQAAVTDVMAERDR
jgi:DNA-binding HxlR family transcriptional regulator